MNKRPRSSLKIKKLGPLFDIHIQMTLRIFLYARFTRKDYLESLRAIFSFAEEFEWEFYGNDVVCNLMIKNKMSTPISLISDHTSLKEAGIDLAITLGGDGTILGATCMIRDLAIPIMGINLGRLGFLAGVEKTSIETALEKVRLGQYRIEERSMLHLDSDPQIFSELNFALNDFTVHKRDNSSMISIHTYINGDYLNSYWADGLIVATPTGSTGYSLSCGGPIVFPKSENMVITAVAPHNLNVRPLVISDDSVISFSIEGRAKNYLCTLDSRYETITSKHQLAIRKCDFNTHLIVLSGQTFLHTIHEKLSWGADRRNM